MTPPRQTCFLTVTDKQWMKTKSKANPECRCQTMSITTSLNVSFISLSFAPDVTGEKNARKKQNRKIIPKAWDDMNELGFGKSSTERTAKRRGFWLRKNSLEVVRDISYHQRSVFTEHRSIDVVSVLRSPFQISFMTHNFSSHGQRPRHSNLSFHIVVIVRRHNVGWMRAPNRRFWLIKTHGFARQPTATCHHRRVRDDECPWKRPFWLWLEGLSVWVQWTSWWCKQGHRWDFTLLVFNCSESLPSEQDFVTH